MGELTFIGGRYTVEFTEAASRQARALDWSEFQRVQGALYELASGEGWVETGRFSTSARNSTAAPSPTRHVVDRCTVTFEVDSTRNVLRVTDVDRPRGR